MGAPPASPWRLAAPTPHRCPPPLNHLSPPQVPSGIILQSKAGGPPAAPQTSASLGPLTSSTASVLVSGPAPSGTAAAPSHPPASAPVATAGRGGVAHKGKVGGLGCGTRGSLRPHRPGKVEEEGLAPTSEGWWDRLSQKTGAE